MILLHQIVLIRYLRIKLSSHTSDQRENKTRENGEDIYLVLNEVGQQITKVRLFKVNFAKLILINFLFTEFIVIVIVLMQIYCLHPRSHYIEAALSHHRKHPFSTYA